MRIVLDTREPALHEKCKALLNSFPLLVQSLDLGDIVLQNEAGTPVLIFERKSLQDLLASIKDGRYEEQSHRLLHASGKHPHNIVYIIEGTLSQLFRPADKQMVLSAITSLSFFKGFSVLRTASLQETAELICGMANKIHKEYEKGRAVPIYGYPSSEPVNESVEALLPSYSAFVKKTKQDNITPENMGEILLCQVPGVSPPVAKEVLQLYGGTIHDVLLGLEKSPEKLNTIYLTSAGNKRRKMGSNVIQNLLRFLSRPTPTACSSEPSVDPAKDRGECSGSELELPLPPSA